jgi:hypothetical protein
MKATFTAPGGAVPLLADDEFRDTTRVTFYLAPN